MADAAWIDFLNADGRPLEQALGRRLEAELADAANPAASGAQGTLVLCADTERIAALNAGLWTFDPASFLAHGGTGDGDAEAHPIWLDMAEPAAGRNSIVTVDDAEPADWQRYGRRAYLFDARDSMARDAGRARWKAFADAGHTLAYWSFDGADWRLERRHPAAEQG